ncbi:restriction endonuclease subunit S [Deferribacterales bacterium Es71-Z0220]|jgi:type I restriction enzyme S subunit|uniref:restriction endonuclease subunit S n=1 Tax=Deferrivibrio essentukiensis TaxID=2880922 RepID=UPI001F61494B|nr:restriction endonuclease subunit S [Deferrivibrio essentukiensis]MBZ4671773.1 Type restriction-modification system, specificity subunit [Deferribacteraceae bacterium]MCB4204560.1 restriction endonuclease subunit S [Deferrivibrio essentukiensis]
MNEKLPEGWKRVKLGEVAEIIMGQSPKSEFYNEKGDGLPFLQGNRTFGYRFPKIDMYCSKPIKIAKKSDVLFSVRAPVGDINIANQDICIGRGLAAIRANNHSITLYLYYLLKFLKNEILNFEGGTVFGSISKKDLEGIETLIPEDINEQKAIASVLSSLDDKIDLLHRQNQTLEQKAETLFRKWFIEEAKEDWEEVKLGELIRIASGKGLKKEEYSVNGFYPVLGANGEIGRTNKFLYDEKLIFTGRVGTLGNVFISEGRVWLSDNTLIIMPQEKEFFYFIYFYLKTIKLEEMNVGSTQPLIRQSDIKNLEIFMPNKELIENFYIFSENLFNNIKQNKRQICTLENLRNTLLPNLMNGKIIVKNKE